MLNLQNFIKLTFAAALLSTTACAGTEQASSDHVTAASQAASGDELTLTVEDGGTTDDDGRAGEVYVSIHLENPFDDHYKGRVEFQLSNRSGMPHVGYKYESTLQCSESSIPERQTDEGVLSLGADPREIWHECSRGNVVSGTLKVTRL